MKLIVNEDEAFKCDFDLLTSIDGVGPITAMTVLAEIGDLRRFERARQLTAYAGVSPRVVQSGTSVRGKTRMCKRGNKRIRQALYLSAMATLNTKKPNSLSTMHYRLCDEGKEGKEASAPSCENNSPSCEPSYQWKTLRPNVQRTWKTQWTNSTKEGNFLLTSNRLSLGYEMNWTQIAKRLELQ